jgi:hypothetical protein
MIISSSPNLLKKQRIEVRAEGDLVVLQIGNAEMRMEHETAIQLSTWLRVQGKEAKRRAGDNSRHWSVVGNLEAVEAGQRPW